MKVLLLLTILALGAMGVKLPDLREELRDELRVEPRAALEEDFGYVEVRPGAHMFWLTYHTDNPDLNYNTAPLIMWLQGGPGASGVGYGNFKELGPYYIDGTLREWRWTQKANLMFVDNPVGTGYSYVDDLSLLATDNKQIADDLVQLLKGAFIQQPEYQTMPFFVYCESYGGKMAADFGLAWDAAIKAGEVTSNFMGVSLGDSWVSPMDSVNTWGEYLYQMGIASAEEKAIIEKDAARTQAAVDAGNWNTATNLWSATELVVEQQTNGVNFYNVLAPNPEVYKFSATGKGPGYLAPALRQLKEGHQTKDDLDNYMNLPSTKDKWNIPSSVTWGGQSNEVFSYLSVDFMKPVISSVEQLLDTTDLHVAVYTGDLDLICDTPGTYRWVEGMNWGWKDAWLTADRQVTYVSGTSRIATYYRRSGRFSLHTFLDAGHMVPLDAPLACLGMIDLISGFAAEAKLEKDRETTKDEIAQKVAQMKHAKQTEEEQRNLPKMRRTNEIGGLHLEDVMEGIEERRDTRDAEARARFSATFKNRATPQGRRLHKDQHIDPRKPIFHQ